MEVLENIPLATHTTFNIGGNARYFVHAQSLQDIQQSFALAHTLQVPVFILGGGSNVLVSDDGFKGIVVKIDMSTISVDYRKKTVTAQSGAILKDVIMQTAQAGLGGWESMYGIPGTIGGAIRGNAGAFGTEIKDVTNSVTAWNSTENKVQEFAREECQFGYRTSFFKQHPEWIVLSVVLQLTAVPAHEALEKAHHTLAERTQRQIQNIQSAGSFFMNPVVSQEIQDIFYNERGTRSKEARVPAGWLIDKCGLKGLNEGPVQTGARSANYLINTGTASAHNVRVVAQKIKDAVYKTFNVALQEEVTMLQ